MTCTEKLEGWFLLLGRATVVFGHSKEHGCEAGGRVGLVVQVG